MTDEKGRAEASQQPSYELRLNKTMVTVTGVDDREGTDERVWLAAWF